MMLILILSTLITCLAAENLDSCPREESIYPCFCPTVLQQPPSIFCQHIPNIASLRDVMRTTRGKNLSFTFMRSDLGDIPSDFFLGQGSSKIDFDMCNITSFGDKPFLGLEDSLTILRITKSIVQSGMETFPLGHLKKLEVLDFQDNNFNRVGNDWFENGPAALSDLSLNSNRIKELGDSAFSSLSNVQRIWLKFNLLSEVSRSMFPRPANKLTTLSFSGNNIASLPYDFFEDMPALKHVYVSANESDTISESVWGKVWDQLQNVYITNSPIICDGRLKWIYQRKNFPETFLGKCKGGKTDGKWFKELALQDFE